MNKISIEYPSIWVYTPENALLWLIAVAVFAMCFMAFNEYHRSL